MSEQDQDWEDDGEENDRLEDEELMQNLIKGIENLKQEAPPSPECPEGSQYELGNAPEQPQTVELDSMSIDELRSLLNQVNEARELNSQLQGMLLIKEVKLLTLKKQIAVDKKEPLRHKPKDEQKIDIGRYYVQFKAPYFKNAHDFATYVIVPESQLPVTAQRYESPAGQWNKNALKDLESNIKNYLIGQKINNMMKSQPKTRKEKMHVINTYNNLRKNAPLSSLAGPDFNDVIDWCSVASKMKKNYSPNECQKAWNIFLRPDINKKKWTVAEKDNLQKIALEHNYLDWDAIAAELGTNRNGYQCFHLYVDKIMKLVEGDWSIREENFLLKLVKECTYGNKISWHKVAYFFETRTITQIYRKWTLSCIGKDIVAGAFTEKEDKTIMEMLIVRKGDFSIGQVAKTLNRIPSQIRNRFAQLKSSLKNKYGEWSLEEDRLLLELVGKFGRKSWSKIAEHMPHRGRVQIRHRYTNLRKRLAKNPELKLEELTRYKRPVHSQRKENNLKCLMELTGLEEKVDTELETKTPQDSTVQAVERYFGPVRKRRLKESEEDLETTRYPEIDDDVVPSNPLGENFDLSDILENESELTTSNASPVKSTNPNLRTTPNDQNSSDSEVEVIPKPRPADLHDPIIEYYNVVSDFAGDLIKPPRVHASRRPTKDETLNSVLKFVPYKYFDPNNADWTYAADRTDPYYKAVFKAIEEKSDSDDDEKILTEDRLVPPCLTNFEGFYNLLVDLGVTEEDLQTDDVKVESELQKLLSQDEETLAAVDRWDKRLASLFAWPAALSGISLETEDPQETSEMTSGAPDSSISPKPSSSMDIAQKKSTSRKLSKRKRVTSKIEEVD